MLRKIISGGQTGVDRAALDAAIECGWDIGGWCPKGRKAEDGVIPNCYPLEESASADYALRTALNVDLADATLILISGVIEGGTALTLQLAKKQRKPYLVVEVTENTSAQVAGVRAWLESTPIGVLNIAGPRESSRPGIYTQARNLLRKIFKELPKEDADKRK